MGGWNAVWQESSQDAHGNAVSAHAIALNCQNSLLRGEPGDIELVGIGLNNIVAVAMRDAVVVADMLDARNAKQAVQFPKDHRPWGWYETLVLGQPLSGQAHPCASGGGALSLKSHVHRSEHWIVIADTAKVTVDDKVQLLSENQSIYSNRPVALAVTHKWCGGLIHLPDLALPEHKRS